MVDIREALLQCADTDKVYYINNDTDDLIVVQHNISIWNNDSKNYYYIKNKIFYNYVFNNDNGSSFGGQLFPEAIDYFITPDYDVRRKYGDFSNIKFKKFYDINVPKNIVNWNRFFNLALKKYEELAVLRDEVCFSKYHDMQEEYFQLLFDDEKATYDLSKYMKLIDKEYCREIGNKSKYRHFN